MENSTFYVKSIVSWFGLNQWTVETIVPRKCDSSSAKINHPSLILKSMSKLAPMSLWWKINKFLTGGENHTWTIERTLRETMEITKKRFNRYEAQVWRYREKEWMNEHIWKIQVQHGYNNKRKSVTSGNQLLIHLCPHRDTQTLSLLTRCFLHFNRDTVDTEFIATRSRSRSPLKLWV